MVARIIDAGDELKKKQQDKSWNKSHELNIQLKTDVSDQQTTWSMPVRKK